MLCNLYQGLSQDDLGDCPLYGQSNPFLPWLASLVPGDMTQDSDLFRTGELPIWASWDRVRSSTAE